MAERAELGGVVRERVRAGGLSGSERNALRAACERTGTYLGARERIDERLAILLAWLHVSSGRPSAARMPHKPKPAAVIGRPRFAPKSGYRGCVDALPSLKD
jgi:hypothetical protein